VTRILFERGKAIGVEYLQDEELRKLYARREIILAAGAFGSPQVLLRSGIGAPSALKAFNIPVVADLPGVGQNLRDHLEFYTSWTCPKEASINSHMTRWGKMRIGLQWLLTRRGLGDSNHCEGIAFVKSGPSAIYCDIELQFMPIQISLGSVPKSSPSGFSICVSHQRPESVGTVALRSLDPRVSPMINPSYLSTDHDRRQARRCIEVVREIVSQRAFDPFRGQELTPGPSIASAAEIDAFCKATGTSGYHPVGTCKMGPETDRSSVVAPNGLVHGVSNLRVVDASIFPSLPTGNTNAPVMMVAEKISDVILDS
jgi:choline dehydrogenase